MKKLNRKGFTLIELLAVIVVLAIVLVVTIPSVISSMNSAKGKQLTNAVGTVTEWFQKNYDIAKVGDSSVVGEASAEYNTFVGAGGLTTTAKDLDATILKAAGISNPTGLSGTVKLNGTKVCVTITAAEGSSFYVNGGTNTVNGSGC